MAIIEVWSRIETILSDKFPEVLANFNSSATSTDLAALMTISQNKVSDVIDFYKIHDGQKHYHLAFSSPWRLLSVKHIQSNLEAMNDEVIADWEAEGLSPDDEAEANGPVKPVLWNEKWIPVAANGGGDLLCIDLDPDLGGQIGQVIVWWHETVLREVLYTSFSELLNDYLRDLQTGLFEFVEGKGLSKV
jgi:cell wall assembly regulator SMI1